MPFSVVADVVGIAVAAAASGGTVLIMLLLMLLRLPVVPF